MSVEYIDEWVELINEDIKNCLSIHPRDYAFLIGTKKRLNTLKDIILQEKIS